MLVDHVFHSSSMIQSIISYLIPLNSRELACGAYLIGIDYHVFLCLLMNASCTDSKQEHS